MRPIMMGVISSKSSSVSLVSTTTGVHDELERITMMEKTGGLEMDDEDSEDEMTNERQKEIALREQIAEDLLRKSSSHLLVTANSSADHLHFIRFSSFRETIP